MGDFGDAWLEEIFGHVGYVDPGECAGVFVNLVSEFAGDVQEMERADAGLRHCGWDFLFLLYRMMQINSMLARKSYVC